MSRLSGGLGPFDAAIIDLGGTMIDTVGDFEVALTRAHARSHTRSQKWATRRQTQLLHAHRLQGLRKPPSAAPVRVPPERVKISIDGFAIPPIAAKIGARLVQS